MLPREIRKALFPKQAEIDINSAIVTTFLNLLEGMKHQAIEYSQSRRKTDFKLYSFEMFQDTTGLKYFSKYKEQARLLIGNMFVPETQKECNDNETLYVLLSSVLDDPQLKKKLGKMVITQLIGGKRLTYAKDFLKDKSFVNTLIHTFTKRYNMPLSEDLILTKDWIVYFNNVRKKLNKYYHIQALKDELRILRRNLDVLKEKISQHTTYQIENIATLYQFLESSIMKPIFENLRKTVSSH